MIPLNFLQDFFRVGVLDIYDAEQQILIAVPKMIHTVHNKTLRAVMESHLQETTDQVTRLEQAMEMLDMRLDARFSPAMHGILRSGTALLDESGSPEANDAACVLAAHMIEHYEIGAYSILATTCRMMDYPPELFSLLSASEDEERSADADLLDVANEDIFAEAMGLVRLESD